LIFILIYSHDLSHYIDIYIRNIFQPQVPDTMITKLNVINSSTEMLHAWDIIWLVEKKSVEDNTSLGN